MATPIELLVSIAKQAVDLRDNKTPDELEVFIEELKEIDNLLSNVTDNIEDQRLNP